VSKAVGRVAKRKHAVGAGFRETGFGKYGFKKSLGKKE